jgi:thymidylate kinase
MNSLARQLESRGHRVHLIEEGAVRSPVPKNERPHFNLWTAAMNVAEILEATYSKATVVLIDRGTFDGLCWMEWYQRSRRLRGDDYAAIRQFLHLRAVRKLTDLVLVMKVDPDEALRRERATRLPTNGTIMNVKTLSAINESIKKIVGQSRQKFELRELDTTAIDQAETLSIVARSVDELMKHAPLAGSATR